MGSLRRPVVTVRMPTVGVQLVIFDCDGVLVNSEAISCRVLAAALTAAGCPTSPVEACRDYRGLLLADVVTSAQARLDRPLPPDWLAQFERDRADAFRSDLAPVPGAAQAVTQITRAGIVTCVASQAKLEKTRLTLGLTGLLKLFADDALFSADFVARGKPQPDLFLYAASAMGAKPCRTVVIEDTFSGVRAAAAAGMRALGYAPEGDACALSRAGAETFRSLSDLPRLLRID